MADTNNTIQQFNIKATADVQSAISKLEALKTTMQSVDKNMSMTGATQSLKQFESELSTMARDIKSRAQEMAKSMSPAELRQAINQNRRTMNSAQSQMTAYGDSMGQMWRNAKTDFTKADTQFQVYQNRLDELSKSSGTIQTKFEGVFDSDKLKGEIFGGGKEMLIDMGSRDYASEIDEFISKAQYVSPTIEKTTTALGTLKFWTRKAFQPQSLQKFANKMSVVSEKAGAISDKMGKVGGFVGNLGKRFLSAINPMRMFNKEQSKTALASSFLGKAFSRLARMFRIMVTRMLIRAFITNIREGFQNIAKYSDEVNRAFSIIGASAKTLYNSVASAFAPLIQAIAPYIVKALDMITSAFNKVAELISAITGKSYYIKATKYNYDYAKSLDKSTKSANKNTKATNKNTRAKKKNKNETIGIDRLNVIAPDKNKSNTNGNGNGAGNKGANVNDMFDTKPVSKKMKNLAKEIKKVAKTLFNPIKEAWDKVGSQVINSWKNALKDVWETIKVIGRDFLTMWEQPATEKIFENIFGVFADMGDTVKNLSSQFREAWTYNNTGLHILENIRDVVGIVVEHIRNCSKYTKEWAKKLDFVPLLSSIEGYTKSLKKLAEGISGIFEDIYKNIILDIYKWVVEKGLPSLIKVFTDFNNEVDWESLRTSLNEVWEGISHFAKAVGQGLIDFIDDLADGIKDLLNSKWFKDFLEGVADALKSIPSGAITNFLRLWVGIKVVKGVSGILGGVASKLGTLIAKIRMFKYSAIGGKIISAFGNIGGKIGNMLGGIDTKLGGFFSNSTSKIKGFVSSLGGLKGMLGIGIATWAGYKIADIMTDYEMAVNTAKYLNEEEKKYLAKLDEEHQKHLNNLQATKDQIDEILGLKDKAYDYKKELDGIVDKNGNIKKGYEGQAQYLIDQLNPALDDNMEIIDGQVKGYKRGTKQLEKQLDLVAQKKILEQGATQYYDNKGELEKGASELSKIQDKIKKSSKATFSDAIKTITSGGNPLAMIDNAMKLYKGDKNTQKALKTYKKTLKSLRESYRYNIRYEALQNAKGKKAREKALKNMGKALTKQEKATFNTIANVSIKYNKSIPELITKNKNFEKAIKEAGLKGKKISQKLREGFLTGKISTDKIIEYQKLYEQAKKKSPKIAKEIANGIKGNKQSVQSAIDKLNAIIDTTSKKREAKVGVKKDSNFNKTLGEIQKSLNKSIPKTIAIRVSAKLDSASVTKASKSAVALSKIAQKGGTLKKQVRGADGHTYAYYTDKNGKTRKKKLYANGGYPKLGSEFIAGEKGAEFVGNINGKTGVASNQEITGIRDSIEDSSAVQNQILAEQNNLLRALLEKNTDIVLDGEKVTKKVNKINARKGYSMAT